MIDCPESVQKMHFKINSKNRPRLNVFCIGHCTLNYLRNSPTNILVSAANDIKNVDFFVYL